MSEANASPEGRSHTKMTEANTNLSGRSHHETKDKVIVALDVSSRDHALRLVEELHDLVGMFKVGSQLFTACGPQVVRDIIAGGGRVFLDLKFHDIPNTVKHAVIEAGRIGVSMMTVHASGGRAMMESVSKELHDNFRGRKPIVVAITVLTSFDTRALFDIGIEVPVEEHVGRLARLAEDCGMDGVVCSPQEIPLLRTSMSRNFKIVTPGIRLANQSQNDQQRTATPHDAIAAGADYIVVGRAVTDDPNSRGAIQQMMQTI